MNFKNMTLEEMCTKTERQQFDRKSARIEATAIATPMIAFANADGGTLAVGIEDHGEMFDERLQLMYAKGARYYEDEPVYGTNIEDIDLSVVAEYLHEYEYVREFGEGVDRMYEEMKAAGLPAPEYEAKAFMLCATIRNNSTPQDSTQDSTQDKVLKEILEYCREPRSKVEIVEYFGYKSTKSFTKLYLKPLLDQGQLEMTIPEKPNSKNQRYIRKISR